MMIWKTSGKSAELGVYVLEYRKWLAGIQWKRRVLIFSFRESERNPLERGKNNLIDRIYLPNVVFLNLE